MKKTLHSYDAIVIGAGFSGAVMAERLASQLNLKVLVLDKRPHIAGNCYDKINEYGIRTHEYGPHLFHTNSEKVWEYLSQFTEWELYEHKVLGRIDGKLAPIPFNLNSLDIFYPPDQASSLTKLLMQNYGVGTKVPILELKKSSIPELQKLADFIYNKIFLNYTCKQWGCTPEEISKEVMTRVPVEISRDDRYFHDRYQALPKQGYTELISRILNHQNIDIRKSTDALALLNLDFDEKKIHIDGKEFSGYLVYTGMLDELFNYQLGELPYRSLRFDFEYYSCDFFQSATTVNYPNENEFTRITEFKHLLSDKDKKHVKGTTIVKEYPGNYDRHDINHNIPYYPVFTRQNKIMYENYKKLLFDFEKIIILGRLAEYRYFNMDDAVENSLNIFLEYDF